jgi:valyl-tRNA synthetase
MMQPQLKEKIARLTRDSFPEGIAAYGTDALRFTYYSLAATGRDIKFDVGRTEGFRNFCNKIWNAARYAMMNSEGKAIATDWDPAQLSSADRWILSRLEQTTSGVLEAVDNYRFDLASQALHEFIWNEYCDWYLELSKPILWDEDNNPEAAQASRKVLLTVLERSLRLLHPFMPFLTEEIWQKLAPALGITGDSIMLQPYPEFDAGNIDAAAQSEIDWLKGIIVAIRNIRGEMDISPAKSISVFLRGGEEQDQNYLQSNLMYLQKLAKLENIEWLSAESEAPAAATGLYGNVEVLVPLAGLIDVSAEQARLEKEIGKLESGLKAVSGKLNNEKFVSNAPEAVVTKERQKQQELQAAADALKAKFEELSKL